MLTLLRHEGTIGVLGRRVLKDGVGVLKSEVVPKIPVRPSRESKVKGCGSRQKHRRFRGL